MCEEYCGYKSWWLLSPEELKERLELAEVLSPGSEHCGVIILEPLAKEPVEQTESDD